MPEQYVQWIRSTISVTANQNFQFFFDHQDYMKYDWKFGLTSQTFVGHVNLSFPNNQAIIVQISAGELVWNPYIELIEVLQRNTITALQQVIFVTA